ncbi:hypothetical protein INR49_031812, partial [Caranx melampygus]
MLQARAGRFIQLLRENSGAAAATKAQNTAANEEEARATPVGQGFPTGGETPPPQTPVITGSSRRLEAHAQWHISKSKTIVLNQQTPAVPFSAACESSVKPCLPAALLTSSSVIMSWIWGARYGETGVVQDH